MMKKWLAAALLLFGLVQPAMSQQIVPDLVETIEIDGAITKGMVEYVTRTVDEINENEKVKVVILEVNSPGGSVTASSLINEELARMRVPIVAWCQYICASGAMYMLMNDQVKYIAVRPDTVSGSIGVIGQVTRYHRLMDWAKMDYEVYRSGKFKDLGNPMRAPDPQGEEQKRFQEIVDTLAAKFYGVVGKHRTITDWPAVKSARIFFGAEAVRVGLVDAVMSRKEVIAKAKELSGSKNIYTRREMEKISNLASNRSSSFSYSYQDNKSDITWLREIVEEMRRGESVKFEYRMPYEF